MLGPGGGVRPRCCSYLCCKLVSYPALPGTPGKQEGIEPSVSIPLEASETFLSHQSHPQPLGAKTISHCVTPLENHGFVNRPLHFDRSCPRFVVAVVFCSLNNVLSSGASRSHHCLRPLDYRKQHQILISWEWVGRPSEQMRSCP